MRRSCLSILAVLALLLHTMVFGTVARGAEKTGTVTGTITIDGRPTSDVVVSVEGLPSAPAKAQPSHYYQRAVMEQRDLRFFPYVLPVMVGATVSFLNDDKVWHNVYSKSEAKTFDLGLYPPGKSKNVTFDKPGVVRILCNVHPTMEAYIVVKEHRFFMSPDKEGNYRFDDVPLGTYKLSVWHPSLGTKVEPFTLERAGEVLSANIDLKSTK